MRCLVIAEAGVNHNGSEELAFKLVDAAVEAGADAVKFQTFKAERLVTLSGGKASYQQRNTGDGDQYSMLKALELSYDAHRRLADYSKLKGIEFLSTAFDEESAEFLIEVGIKRIKVPSGELTNLPFISFLAEKNLPMILSTGMATLREIKDAVHIIKDVKKQFSKYALGQWVSILHCTSNYPVQPGEVNLRAMQTIADTFHLPVGYSDHTLGGFVAPLAVAMGARVIEKHFTLGRDLRGPDHAASLEPYELKKMIADIRSVEIVLGSQSKEPTESEMEVRKVVRRSITLRRALTKGTVLSEVDIVLLRPGTGIAPRFIGDIIGERLVNDLDEGHTLQWEDIGS